MSASSYPRVASLKTADAFRQHLRACGASLEFDDDPRRRGARRRSARPFELDGVRVGNRFCILPMEGWDGTADGEPSDLTRRRWERFGVSGAKLIWGGEAVAVQHDGRANPNQLVLDAADAAGDRRPARRRWSPRTARRFGAERRRRSLRRPAAHALRPLRQAVDQLDGRSRSPPTRIRILDRRFPAGVRMLTDDDLDRLVERFIATAKLAWDAGFAFVDVKHCHGYLGHELLSARQRPGRYGGLAREPHALPPLDRRGHPRHGSRPAHRRPAVGVRHGAVQEERVGRRRAGRIRDAVRIRVRVPRQPRRGYGRGARRRARAARAARGHRRALGLHHGRQPVLQPAHAAAGAVSAERRLPAARGSAGRRGAADSPRRRA